MYIYVYGYLLHYMEIQLFCILIYNKMKLITEANALTRKKIQREQFYMQISISLYMKIQMFNENN